MGNGSQLREESFSERPAAVGQLCREAGGRKLAAKLVIEHAALGKILDLS
jgi:hypothetical protein